MSIVLVSDVTPRSRFVASGVQTDFTTDWCARLSTDVEVTFGTAGTVPGIAYSFLNLNTEVTSGAGFTVVFVSAPPVNTIINIIRVAPAEQDDDFGQQNAFSAAAVNGAFADLVMQDQQIKDGLTRSIRVSPYEEPGASLELPSATERALGYLSFDSVGNAIVNALTVETHYLGAHAVDPTTRNDMTPLQVGDLYFNSGTALIRGWNGSLWGNTSALVATPAASGVSFTPTGTIAATNTQAAVAEVSGDVTALTATVTALTARVTTLETTVASLGTGQAVPPAAIVFGYFSIPWAGWLFLDGKTIGDASSGATARANADTQNLFVQIYNSTGDGGAPVSGGRTGNAQNDFAAHKTLQLSDSRGCVLLTRDDLGGTAANRVTVAGGNFDATIMGARGGLQSVTLSTGQMPAHQHEYYIKSGGVSADSGPAVTMGSSGVVDGAASPPSTQIVGGGSPHANVQPSVVFAAMVKL